MSDQFLSISRRFSLSIVNRSVCCYQWKEEGEDSCCLINKPSKTFSKTFLGKSWMESGSRNVSVENPDSWKSGKIFWLISNLFFGVFFCLHVACVWANPSEKNWMDVKQSLNKSWRNYLHWNVNFYPVEMERNSISTVFVCVLSRRPSIESHAPQRPRLTLKELIIIIIRNAIIF